MYDNIDVSSVIDGCDFIARHVTTIGGKYHGSAWLFDKCMRAFDNKHLPAQSITFAVFHNYPVGKPGTAEIDRQGHVTMRVYHTKDG